TSQAATDVASASQPAKSSSLSNLAWQRWAPFAAGFYLAGVLLLLARLTIGLHGGRRLCRQAAPVTDSSLLALLDRQVQALGLRAAPVLAACQEIAVPTVVGILRPTILLPL